MATVTNNFKSSVGYVAENTGESTSKVIAGLNFGNGSAATGPNANTGITHLINTVELFSLGTLGNIRFIQERAVTR